MSKGHQRAIYGFVEWLPSLVGAVSAEEFELLRAVVLRMIEEETLHDIFAVRYRTPEAANNALREIREGVMDDELFKARFDAMQDRIDGV
jgi:hypothetical protein